MFRTEDFEIKEIIEQREYSGVVRVGTEISKDLANNFFDADEYGISTRSRLARVFSDFYVLDEPPKYKANILTAMVGYRSLSFPIFYQIGDKVGRFYACNLKERIEGKNLKRMVQDKIPGKIKNSETIEVELEDIYFRPEKLGEAVEARRIIENPADIYIKRYNGMNWNVIWDETLLATKEIMIPSRVFGLIRETTWHGNTHHLNSRIIDPKWNGSLIVEINAHEDPANFEKPKLLIELYRMS